MSQRPPHPLQNVIDSRHIEFLCLKRTTTPGSIMFKFLMPRLEDHLQEFLIATWTSNVFGRTTTLAGNANRAGPRAVRRKNLLQDHLVLPVVAEVVHVDRRIAQGLQDFANRHLAFVYQFKITEFIGLRVSPIFSILLELMEMAISPADHGLNCIMEAAQEHRTGNLHAPPDG